MPFTHQRLAVLVDYRQHVEDGADDRNVAGPRIQTYGTLSLSDLSINNILQI